MVIPGGVVIQSAVPVRGNILYFAISKSVVVVWVGQDGIQVKHRHIVVGVVSQPVVHQPGVESPGVLGVADILHRWGSDRDKELILPGGKVVQQLVVDVLGITYCEVPALGGRVCGAAAQV